MIMIATKAASAQVAVTGWALRTPLGVTPERVVERLLAGERAVQANPYFAAETYPCRLAAAVPGEPGASPHARILRRMGRFALETAHEALAGSSAAQGKDRLGVFAAMGGLRAHWDELMPALARQHDDFRNAWASGLKDLHPFWMLRHLSNNAHALLAQDIGARGEGVTFAGANAGAPALAAAMRALADGAIDVALVVAYDSLIEPESIIEMAGRGALATCDAADLGAPYSERANGAVPGEAAATVLLEPADRAGDRALALIDAADGADGDKAWPTADTLARVAARLADNDAIVDGCALAAPKHDSAERQALAGIVGPGAHLIAIQAATGLLGAATSVVQAIVLASLLRAGSLPPIAGLGRPAPGPLVPVAAPIRITASSALGVSVGAPGLAAAIRVCLPPFQRQRTAP